MIEVLLATYNGEAFLAEQIDSVLAQEGVTVRILARDDGSSDGTAGILERYACTHSNRFTLFRSPGRLGISGNFGWLLERSGAPYVAFCDQDDVWATNKLGTLLARIRALETEHGLLTPLLVHSDLEVIDHRGRQIHPSFWKYAGIDPRRSALHHVILKNPVTGCTLLANRALIEKACPIPAEARMHDHWIALVATAFGKVEAMATRLVSYRQHECNAVGAISIRWHPMIRRVLVRGGWWDLIAARRQALAFADRYGSELDPAEGLLVERFAKLSDLTWIECRWFLLRRDILFPGAIQNLALLFLVRLR